MNARTLRSTTWSLVLGSLLTLSFLAASGTAAALAEPLADETPAEDPYSIGGKVELRVNYFWYRCEGRVNPSGDMYLQCGR